MTLRAFWLGVAALVGIDDAMRLWTTMPHCWWTNP
jgi:hypothetical protein